MMQPIIAIQADKSGLIDFSSRSRSIVDNASNVVAIGGRTYYNLAGTTAIKFSPDERMMRDKWTIDAWIYIPESHNNYGYFFTLSNGVDYTHGLVLAVRETRAFLAQYGTGDSQVLVDTSAGAIPSLERVLVTVTYNAGTLKLYINGSIYGTAAGAVANYSGVRPYFGYDPRNPSRVSNIYIEQLTMWDDVKYNSSFSPKYIPYSQLDFFNNNIEQKISVPTDHKGVISDKVLIKGLAAIRKVCLYRRGTNELVATTWSDASGNYRFDNLRPNTEYYVLSIDHERNYNAVIQDMIRTT